MSYYPDISHYSVVTSWADLKKNCPFIISKATQGTGFVDSSLFTFISECERRKIPYWLYAYLNQGDELAQTKFLVATCRDKVGDYFRGYALDVENDNAVEDVRKSLDYLNKLGGKNMIYTAYWQYDTYRSILDDRPDTTAWWEARYGLNDGTYNGQFPAHPGADLQQYTDRGIVPGLEGYTDLNRLTGRKPETWFTEPLKKAYSGTFPALPPRGYYQKGDGMSTLTNYPTQIKRLQKLANWVTDGNIAVDGKFGSGTESAVRKMQGILGVKADGKFGKATLAAAKAYKK